MATTKSSRKQAEGHTALRREIVGVGRKLWLRNYVDGNGGNISARIGANRVLCTPTMISKGDLKPAYLCICDLDGKHVHGRKQITSEILLHLAIYKTVPAAQAVVHCHPPHGTACGLVGALPPEGLTPEGEVFVGRPALVPYETPGTAAFANGVVPFAARHNVMLLQNHGIVCWSDSVTHAEWLVEVLEAICQTWHIAKHIGGPLHTIGDEKLEELLALKRKMNLPDPRL